MKTRLAAAICAVLASCAVARADARVAYFPVQPGAHPHDVAAAPDGNIWFTAPRQGALGVLDPKTGKVEQVKLGSKAMPQGVIAGPDGAAWITESGQNAIARVDPQTKEVKLFALPRGYEKANLNTATFDKAGKLWFTGQNGFYGRVDPENGKVDVWKSPKGLGPYGIATTPSGDIWFASLAGDYIARIDPETAAVNVVDAQARRRPAPHLVGLKGPAVGEFLASGRARPLRPCGEDVGDLRAAEEPERLLRGVR